MKPSNRIPGSRLQRRSAFLGYGSALVVFGAVLLIAWLQYRWLTALRHEEEARRRIALSVAVTHFQERIDRKLEGWLRSWRNGPDTRVDPDRTLIDARVVLADGADRIRTGDGDWRPASAAELQQWLGRRLLLRLRDGGERATGLWLAPPALVACNEGCSVAVLSEAALAGHLAETAEAVFADLRDLHPAVVQTHSSGRLRAILHPRDERARSFQVTDVDAPLLDRLPVLGPADAHWRLWANHAGSSLEAAVSGSHLRNLLLSALVLLMLGLALGLVLLNVRRTRQLAEREIFFAASISHELRTPLSVIGSAADNLADGTVRDGDRVRRYGEVIRTEARRLGGMIENVLQFSRSASGVELRQRAVDPAALVEDALEACADALETTEVHTALDDDLPRPVGDPGALRVVLENLIRNAASYAAGEPRWVRIGAAVVRVRPRGRALRIAVSNPIRGRLEHPERLFEPFHRGRNAVEAGTVGTGIGLAVARRIAQRHGGGLAVDTSRPDVVTFNLYLPLPGGKG